MFDTSFIPGEAATAVNWTKIHNDFNSLGAEETLARVRDVPTRLYPIFEVAVWELDSLHNLLAALDAHRVALEQRLTSSGDSRAWEQKQLDEAENELCLARSDFLEAFHQLNQKKNTSIQDEEKQIFSAVNALWDLEAVWERHAPNAGQR